MKIPPTIKRSTFPHGTCSKQATKCKSNANQSLIAARTCFCHTFTGYQDIRKLSNPSRSELNHYSSFFFWIGSAELNIEGYCGNQLDSNFKHTLIYFCLTSGKSLWKTCKHVQNGLSQERVYANICLPQIWIHIQWDPEVWDH